jgi:hypothetical protein
MRKLIDKFYNMSFEVSQFIRYHDTHIMVAIAFAIVILFALGAKNLALLIALIYIMAKVTK